MNTSTSLQALAVLALGGALLASATPADAARGGFRSAPVRSAPVRAATFAHATVRAASFNRAPTPASAHVAPMRGNARSLLGDLNKVGGAIINEGKTVGGDILSGKIAKIPGDVVKTGSNVAGAVVKTGVNIFTLPPPKLPNNPTPVVSNAGKPIKVTGQPTNPGPVFVPPSTSTGPVFVPPTSAKGPVFAPNAPQSTSAVSRPAGQQSAGFPTRPQIGGRPVLVSVPVMSPGPAYVAPVVQPAPVAPVVVAPTAPAPVQPSCLRQAVTQDGQVVTFDICTNQAVVGPLAQVQTQPQTQTQ